MTFVTILSADLLGEVAEDLILELSNKMLMLFVEFRNYDIDTVSIQTIFEEKLNVIHRHTSYLLKRGLISSLEV